MYNSKRPCQKAGIPRPEMLPGRRYRALDKQSSVFLKRKGQTVEIYDVFDGSQKCQVIDNKRFKND